MATPEDNAKTVHRYLELVAQGKPDDIAELYAEDATVEDPVGGEVHIGRTAIRGFYDAVANMNAECDVVTLRTLGSEAAFFWSMTIDLGESRMRIEIISVMTFNEEGKIASMKAYWTPENVTQL
ncbi:nuclear transport factor 2 family protein [Mycolicibacterium pulveris]|uniref:Steroid Delta-isomerase n=1 Tax=Mycolicibacterium pulveris TaxID=36813 RepID=A0A7I7UQ56_MYCPV|nr:nuclear transport factor 2 family protein [Mycolicibacterium pulveris]MCV6981280.1 nuclear transport factor 2 family protein [Mycolicibacterium pulveris]BBY82276.1 steroid Delta-isomerase [Mycolicibacterium pulveris]